MSRIRKLTKWDYLKYFHSGERWGNPDKMDFFTLIILDRLRHKIGYPFIVHCGYATSGHVKNSQHYLGRAVDFHIDTPDLFFEQQIEKLEYYLRRMYVATVFGRIPMTYMTGLGIYPQAKIPYFHLDTRGHKARWSFLDAEYTSYERGLAYVRNNKI